jgi:protein-tyrosine phosphatase
MIPELYWIPGPWPGRLAIANRPRGGDWLLDETRGLSNAGVNVLVSLLEPEEEQDLELQQENNAAKAAGIDFISYPIPDRSVPASVHQAAGVLAGLSLALDHGKTVAVHCRQGIGRSAVIAASLLVAAGHDPTRALELVSAARGIRVPETREQQRWVEQVAPLVRT